MRNSCWFYTSKKRRAVALVIHGLNTKPEKMNSIATMLTEYGVDALRITLAGHDGNIAAMKTATRNTWLQDTFAGYCEAQRVAQQNKVPLILVAFSLGALITNDLASENPLVKFDKQILFAPALAIHWFSYLLKSLSVFKSMVIPSAAPAEYRANYGTTMAAYGVLFESLNTLKKNNFASLAASPTLIIIDPNDELVNAAKLREMQNQNWQLLNINAAPDADLLPKYHHLIIDRRSTGSNAWNVINQTIETFLSNL